MNLTLQAEDLITLLKLRDHIFKGVEIPSLLAEEIKRKDPSNTIFFVEIQFSEENETKQISLLWLYKNWKSLGEQQILEKEKERKQRRLWNLISECIPELENAIMKKTGMKRKEAHNFVLLIIEKKRLVNVAPFLDNEKFKDILL